MSQITEDIKKSLSVLAEVRQIDMPDSGIAPGGASVDWKARPEEVIEAVDQLLEHFGLEVVMYESLDDSFQFDIVKKQIKQKQMQLPKD